MALDLDRPFTSRKHPSGVRIYMHLDQPGTYYDERGRNVSHKMAADCGFDVSRALIEQDKKNRLDEYRKQLDREFATRSAELDMAAELSSEDDGIAVVPLPAGGFKVTVDEQVVTNHPLSIEEAEKLVEGYRSGEDETENPAPAAAEERPAGSAGASEGATPQPDRGGVSDLM